MSAEDSAAGVPIPAREAAPPPLRVYEPPPAYRQGRLALDWRPGARPESIPLRLNGRRVVVRHWTAEEWARVPEAERPARSFAGDRGGRLAIEGAEG